MEQKLLHYTMKAAFYAEAIEKADKAELRKEAGGFGEALQKNWQNLSPALQKALIGGAGGGALGAGAGYLSAMGQPERKRNSLRSALMGGIGGAGLGAGIGYLSENGVGGKKPDFSAMGNAKLDTDPSKVPSLSYPGGTPRPDANAQALKSFWDNNMAGQPNNVQLANIQKVQAQFGPDAANSLMKMYEKEHAMGMAADWMGRTTWNRPISTGGTVGGVAGFGRGAWKEWMKQKADTKNVINANPLTSRFQNWLKDHKGTPDNFGYPKGVTPPGSVNPLVKDMNGLSAALEGVNGYPGLSPAAQQRALNYARLYPEAMSKEVGLPSHIGGGNFVEGTTPFVGNRIINEIGSFPPEGPGLPTRLSRIGSKGLSPGAWGTIYGAGLGMLGEGYKDYIHPSVMQAYHSIMGQ